MSQKFNFKKHYEIFDIILTEQNINQVDDLGCAAIHYAVQSSFFETVQEVIKRGGDIQQRTATGASVWDIFLNNLSQKGNSFFSNKDHQAQRRLICKLLVSIYKFNFSDPSDKRNFHALLISPVKNEEENALFQSLLEHCTSDFLNQNVTCASVPFLIYFMQNKQYNKIEPLLKKGVDVNCRDDNGNTFLMNLILADAQLIPEKYELIQLALAHNPDLETLKNNENETILESVRRSTDEKTLELFKDYLEPHPVMKLRNI